MSRARAGEAALAALVVVVAAVAVAQAWDHSLDPIIDVGRDLYVPEQLRHGTKLYRDILYFYPPLAPYLLALTTAVTGSSLAAYQWIGVTIGAATAAALYAITRVAASPAGAASATLLFAACNLACGPRLGGTNYLFPYAHAATLAMLFFLIVVAALMTYVFVTRRPSLMVLAVVCAVAAAWSKIELAVFAAAMLLLVVVVHRLRWTWLAAYAALASSSIAGLAVYFHDAPGWFRTNVIPESLLGRPAATAFYRSVIGLDAWQVHLGESGIGVVEIVLFALLVIVADRVQSRGARAVAVVAAIAFGALIMVRSDVFFRAWTLLQLALVPFALRRPREPLFLLLVASLMTTSRIALNITPVWYGFVFTVPLYALIAYVLFAWLPARRLYSSRAAWLWCAPILLIAATWLQTDRALLAARRWPIITRRGTFYDANRDRAAILSAFVKGFRGRSLAAIPEGLTLNYFTATPTTLRFQTFTPVEAGSPEAERAIVADFAAHGPEYVAIVTRDVREFGFGGFGLDYDRDVARFLVAHYQIERRWRRPLFELILLRAKSATTPPGM